MDQAKFVEYVRVSQAALSKQAAELRQLRARLSGQAAGEKRAAEALAPLKRRAVETLRASGLMRAGQEKAAGAAFDTHEGALRTLIVLGERAVPRRLAEAPERIGDPEPAPSTKRASDASGAGQESEANRRWAEGFAALRRR